MGSTLLQLTQDAAIDLGVNMPATLFAADDNGDTSDVKLLRAATRTLKYLAGTYDWQVLRRECVFQALAQESQIGALPSDFLRFVPETMWDRTSRWRVAGPTSPAEWQEIKTWITAAVTPYFCQRGDTILFYPVPTANNKIGFEYIANTIGFLAGATAITGASTAGSSTLTVASTTGISAGMEVRGGDFPPGSLIKDVPSSTTLTLTNTAVVGIASAAYSVVTPLTRFQTDTDVVAFDDELITQGIVYQYRKAERFDYAQDQQDFLQLMNDRIKQDGGRRPVNMARGRRNSAQDRIEAMRSAAVVIKA